MRRLAGLTAAALCLVGAPAAAAQDQVRTPDDPAYTFRLRSDTTGATWRGSGTVTFRNAGTAPLRRVWLRLWPNGIAGCAAPRALTVRRITGGRAGTLRVGCTALPVDLTRALAPGARGRLAFDLTVAIPPNNDRFGRIDARVLAGNALPVLAIEDARGVHLEPYVPAGESFYSQVGRYRVTFDTPRAIAVGATGVTGGATPRPGGRVVRTFTANRVRDFAWVAGSLRQRTARTATGVRVRVWYAPDDVGLADQTLRTSVGAMERFDALFGAYPYPEVDVVLVPFASFGGMEYPTLVMTTASPVAIAHELAHQWWYGLVGDDQYAEPWLDEAFATWAEARYADAQADLCVSTGWPGAEFRLTNDMAFWQRNRRYYGAVVYRRGACALQQLSERVGAPAFDAFIRRYAVEHRFGWSTTAGFKAAVEEVASSLAAPVDLTDFWAESRIG